MVESRVCMVLSVFSTSQVVARKVRFILITFFSDLSRYYLSSTKNCVDHTHLFQSAVYYVNFMYYNHMGESLLSICSAS